MRATDLYNQLEKDFVKAGITENWFDYMQDQDDYICCNFRERSMGLLYDFTEEIGKVYTAVFPSDKVLQGILDDKASHAMLFVHHPLTWDLDKNPNQVFYPVRMDLLEKLKENHISVFNFHYPLDHFGKYATSKTLAEALGVAIEQPFAECNGAMCGVIGTIDCKDIHELNDIYAKAVGHETKLYQYGTETIKNNRVGVCAGGGNDLDVVEEIIRHGINVLISGLSVKNAYSVEAHRLEKEHGINLLGGTHYSSEKFACIAICDYFRGLGLRSEFIHDVPCFADL